MTPLAPCDTAPLFRPLAQELVGLLRELAADDWLRPTVAGAWRVRDVAAHLLDGQLRKLSAQRDGHLTPLDRPVHSDQDLAREPLLDISVRALPYAYAGVRAAAGTTITLAVTGVTTGSWTLARGGDRWQIGRGQPAVPDAKVTIAADDVWRMFYNALVGEELRRRVTVAGDADLAAPLLRARSVMV